jgi:hypothetical protein
MIKSSKAILASVPAAILARPFRHAGIKGLKMPIEHIKSREHCTTLTRVRLMLLFLSVSKKIGLGP